MGWRTYVLLALFSLAMFLPGQSRLPPVDRDESRYAQATRQMVESRDFIDVRYQDRPRYLQPVGVYWLQSLSVSLLSSSEAGQIWAYRVPSLLAATASVLLTGWIGSMLFGAEAGVVAALLMAMCALLNFEARMAKIDATLLATTLVAQGALLRAYLGRAVSTRRNAFLFWAALGVGLMLKGPIILIVSGTSALGASLLDRQFAWLKRLHAGWGVPVALAITLPWFTAIGVKTHGAFFAKAIGQNLLGKLGRGEQAHGAFPGYYLALFSLTFWPGSLAAVLAAPWTWRHRASSQVRFLAAWIVPTWLIYEAIATKLPHYALPYYPAIACLAAGAATTAGGWRFGRAGRALALAYSLVWLAVGVGVSGVGALLIWRYRGVADPVAITAAVFALALIAAVLVLLAMDRRRVALGCAGGAAFIIAATLCSYSLPAAKALWIAPAVAQAVAKVRPCPDSVLASSGFSEPSLVFLIGGATRLIDVSASADWLASHATCGLALVEAGQLPAFETRAERDHLGLAPVAEIHGVNYSRGKPLDLTLFKARPASP